MWAVAVGHDHRRLVADEFRDGGGGDAAVRDVDRAGNMAAREQFGAAAVNDDEPGHPRRNIRPHVGTVGFESQSAAEVSHCRLLVRGVVFEDVRANAHTNDRRRSSARRRVAVRTRFDNIQP